jgi:4-hydroxythreonine-4-phosphate dehydrogenase
MKPLLGFVLGDWTGVGPEQCARVLADQRLADAARLLVIGDLRVLQQGAKDAGVKLDVRTVATPEAADWASPAVQMMDLGNFDPAPLRRGAISADSGRLTGETLKVAVDLALAGRLDGITFAPLNKAALHAGGWKFNDEHQMFAHLTRHQGFFGEMNVLDNLWMSRVTSHVSLRTALDQITPQRIDEALTLADRTMRGAGFDNPRIAVCALNPHAGENGLFGREEIDLIAPAVAAAAARGIGCKGPYPSGHRVPQAFKRGIDGVLSMYPRPGDRSRPCLKGINPRVTETAGLETVFTTPAHWAPQFDIVGQGKARPPVALEHAGFARLAASLWHASTRSRPLDGCAVGKPGPPSPTRSPCSRFPCFRRHSAGRSVTSPAIRGCDGIVLALAGARKRNAGTSRQRYSSP